MFSGIVESVGVVEEVRESSTGYIMVISSKLFQATDRRAIQPGDSISISGVCLTAQKIEDTRIWFDVASETRRVTTLEALTVGSKVNIERALQVGKDISGHFVTGHVDAVVEIVGRAEEGGNTVKFSIALPSHLRPFVAPKGSVTVNGTSLTVGEVKADSFSVYIVPHTLSNTTFFELVVKDRVNLEIDVLARYVVNALRESSPYGK